MHVSVRDLSFQQLNPLDTPLQFFLQLVLYNWLNDFTFKEIKLGKNQVYDVVTPVADGKKIPTRSVNDVAMSADTYMPKFSMALWASTDCSPGFSKISPFCM